MVHFSKRLSLRLGLLLLGAALFVVGCDSVGSTAEKGEPDLLKVTNDLGDRMTVYPDQKATALSSAFTLRAVSRIKPPSNAQSASHISASGSDIFVGYKVPGETFGGGIDILDKQDPTRLTNEDNALRSTDLDVQEVAYDETGSGSNNLFVAGAVDYGKIDARDYGNTPAVAIRAEIDDNGNVETQSGNVLATEAAMPDALTKSVTLASSGDDHDVYAVTDGDSFFEFNSNLGDRQEWTSQGTEFNSVTSLDTRGFALALTRRGKVLRVQTVAPDVGAIDEVQNFSSLEDNGIARISTHVHSGTVSEELAYVALNSGGLAVLNDSGTEVRYRKSDEYYVSVTATDDLVFAAGPGGTIDVFSVGSGLTTPNTSEGLSLQASFDLGGLDEIGTGSGSIGSAQVNQILATNDYLYVAASDEGVVVLEIAGDQGDIF